MDGGRKEAPSALRSGGSHQGLRLLLLGAGIEGSEAWDCGLATRRPAVRDTLFCSPRVRGGPGLARSCGLGPREAAVPTEEAPGRPRRHLFWLEPPDQSARPQPPAHHPACLCPVTFSLKTLWGSPRPLG